jgi:hypothetical protein
LQIATNGGGFYDESAEFAQTPQLGAQFYEEASTALPYYFMSDLCSHEIIVSIEGAPSIKKCDKQVCNFHIFDTPMMALYCWDHYQEFGREDARCPCPMPTDGTRCFNLHTDGHCCSQVDATQNCRRWYYDPSNRFPDQFCMPHCRLDIENFELYGQ